MPKVIHAVCKDPVERPTARAATTAANTTKYKDTKAQKRQTYYYRVAAKNNVGLSSYSNTVTTP